MNNIERKIQRWDRWFRRTQKEFSNVANMFAGQPILYVEIGVWAGATIDWMFLNVLTHPDSRALCLDPYPVERRHPKEEIDEISATAQARVNAMGGRGRLVREASVPFLRMLSVEEPKTKIDLLYVDGNHDAHAVVQDFCAAWPMLRPGSVVIFDDYVIAKKKGFPNVKEGVDALTLAFGPLLWPIDGSDRQRAFKISKGPTYQS